MLENLPTSLGTDTTIFVMVSNATQWISKELGKHRVSLGFSLHTDLKRIHLQRTFFTSIETNKHTYGSSQTFLKAFLFRKYRIFWWFFKQYKHSISNTTYELTNISYVDVFQNTCILREPVNQGKSYSVTVAVYF